MKQIKNKGPESITRKWYSRLIEKNATGVLIAIMFFTLLMSFTVITLKCNLTEKHIDAIINIFSPAIMGMIGFFAGTNKAK